MEKETEVSAGARADDGEVGKDKEEGNMEVDQKDKEEAEGEGGKADTKEGGKDKEKDAQEGEGEEEEDAFLSPLDMLQVILWRIRIFYKVSKTYASLCSISIFFKDFFLQYYMIPVCTWPNSLGLFMFFSMPSFC